MNARLASVLLALVLALAIAGCGTDPDEGSAPADPAPAAETETATTSTTTTPSATTTEGTTTTTTTTGEAGPTTAEQLAEQDIGLIDEAGQVIRPFAETSPWNTSVANAPVDPASNEMLERAATRLTADATPGDEAAAATQSRDLRDIDLFVNTTEWTVPVVTEEGGAPTALVCRQELCGPESDRVDVLTIPPDVSPAPGNDGWFSVLDLTAGVGYDLWRGRRDGDVISYQFIKRWELDGPGFSAPVAEDPVRAVGARGSGLPLFAGLIHPEELLTGSVDHALAISIPGPAQRRYVQPASVTNGINVGDSLPEGARIRLRDDARLGALPPGANPRSREILIETLKSFGAIVVDRSRVPTLYARRNADYGTAASAAESADVDLGDGGAAEPRRRGDRRVPLLRGDELEGIELDDFEVIELGPLLDDPPGISQFEAAEEQFDVTPEAP